MQNLVFHEETPKPAISENTNNSIKEVNFHLIQLHSLKGVTFHHEDKKQYFNFYIRHFWEIIENNNKQALIYRDFEPRVINKIDEMLFLSLDNDPKPNVIMFPENSIPYSYIKDLIKFSKQNEVLIIGGLEHKKFGSQYKNKGIIIDNGILGIQEKQTPVNIGNIIEDIDCKIFPGIKIFKTSIGKVSVFICKDFLRLSDIIPYWALRYDIDYIFIPSLTSKVLPFHYDMLRSLKYSDYPDLNIVFCNVGEYVSSSRLPKIKNKIWGKI